MVTINPEKYVKQWIIPTSDSDRIKLSEWLSQFNFGILLECYDGFISQYSNVLSKTSWERKEFSPSGFFCYYGGMLMSICQWGRFKHNRSMCEFNLLYLYVDHHIDDPNLPMDQKASFIEHITGVMRSDLKSLNNNEPYQEFDYDGILKGVIPIYRSMINNNANVLESLIELFNAEIRGMVTQFASVNRNTYYRSARDKGGKTTRFIQMLLTDGTEKDPDHLKNVERIGICFQLVDDIIDVVTDIDDGINTVATFDLRSTGNIDRSIDDAAREISLIQAPFQLFKVALNLILCYAVSRSRYVSSNIKRSLRPYTYFDNSLGLDLFKAINAIHKEKRASK